MCEILGQSHWCSQDSISRIKILISNPQVPNIKTCPKSLNYRYAGFQILDWNSNFQSPLVWTNEKLLRIFTHKDLFTIKKIIDKNIVYYKFLLTKTPSIVNFIHDNIVYIKCLSKTDSNCPSHLCFPLSFSPLLWYNITHSSNSQFLSRDHTFKKNDFQFYASRKALDIKVR